MRYTLFARNNDMNHGGQADVASRPATQNGDSIFVGCCAGEVDAEPCLWQAFTDDPVKEADARGVAFVQEPA